ncbi:ESPR-type extended signal peptide-containing protein, partial [Escherichia coli]|uniref:ESPR-type extended signal peptide-containing protein n=1 Tax=Escherichia coli TaxID=562 RepID=UPI002552F519
MNRIYRVIWNCTLQVFQVCSELTRRVGKKSTVNLRKSSGLTTKFSRLTLGVLLALSGSLISIITCTDTITSPYELSDVNIKAYPPNGGTLGLHYDTNGIT